MLERRTPSDFRARPRGGFVAGAHWLYFATDDGLFGYAIWGDPLADDIRALVRVLELELDRPRHDALVDLGGLELVRADAFQALAAYTVANADRLSRVVEHTAIVRPPGVNGAIVSGFFDVSAKPFPVSFWPDVERALVHLGRSAADASRCAAALDAAREDVARAPAILQRLRAHLASHVGGVPLPIAARDLGVSARTLQRRLGEHRTTFEAETRRARVRTAERMLAETDAPITTIALELGFATPQHFATVFRQETGLTPSAYRARKRA